MKESDLYKKSQEVFAAFNAKRLYTKALCCGIVYKRKRVKSLLVEGLNDSLRDFKHANLEKHPGSRLTEPARYADMLVKIADQNVITCGPPKNRPSL